MVMLSGVRAFVEQQPAADDYTKFKWGLINFENSCEWPYFSVSALDH